jgi:hypothetical protein
MQRILSLPTSFLRTGSARSEHDEKGGAWVDAIGLNPFIADDNYRFLLATTATPTRIGSTEITDIPIAYATDHRNDANAMYILGGDGRFYRVLSGSDSVTVVRPQSTLTAITGPTGGMVGASDSGGNEYLFLCRATRLVRWNYDTGDSTSHWNESTAIEDTPFHPMLKLFDSIYFGNKYKLGRIPLDETLNDAGSLANVETEVCRIDNADMTITALGTDGRYLIFAANVLGQSSSIYTTEARVFWYATGSNWEYEATLKGERAIRAIIKTAIGTFAIGDQTIYELNFGLTPRLVHTFPSADNITYDAASGNFRANGAAPYGDSVIFGNRGAIFGKRFPTEPITFSHPLQGHTGNISMIAPDFVKPLIYVAGENDTLWKYDMSSAGSNATAYTTRWLDLNDEYNVMRLEIEMPEGIGASDSTSIVVVGANASSDTITISQNTIPAADRYFVRVNVPPAVRSSKIKLQVTQSAGTPKFGAIHVLGEKVEQ